jgi:hypothetical protein
MQTRPTGAYGTASAAMALMLSSAVSSVLVGAVLWILSEGEIDISFARLCFGIFLGAIAVRALLHTADLAKIFYTAAVSLIWQDKDE